MLRQPVPWPYFHLVNVLQIFVLSILGMAIVGFAHPVVTIIVHAMNCLVFLGLKELACVMSDPFGDDVIDFKVDAFLRTSYINAVAHLEEDRPVTGPAMPQGISLPMMGVQKRKTPARAGRSALDRIPTIDRIPTVSS